VDLVRPGLDHAVEHGPQLLEVADAHRHAARGAVADQLLALGVVVLGMDRDVRRLEIGIGDAQRANG
jgi:hypothetical protein